MDNAKLLETAAPWLGLAGAGVLAVSMFLAAGDDLPGQGTSSVITASKGQVESALGAKLAENPALKDDLEALRQSMEEGAEAQALFVAEAFRQGLAQHDYIVRNRLVELQVMTLYDKADAGINDQAVEKYYNDNRDRYLTTPRRQYLHLFVPVTNLVSEAEARARVERLVQDGAPGEEPRWVEEEELRKVYGPALARQVFEMPVGEWNGPIRSGMGWHYIRVLEEEPVRQYGLEEVRERVTEDLRRELRQEVYKKELERLRGKYKVEWAD